MTSSYVQYRRYLILGFHAVAIAFSVVAAFALRFDYTIPSDIRLMVVEAVALALVTKLPVFVRARLHAGSWRFAGIRDLGRLAIANAVASTLFTAGAMLWLRPSGFPRSVSVIDLLVCFIVTGGAQFALRAYQEVWRPSRQPGKPILIYGAGAAGRMLLRELQANHALGYDVLGFIDDDPALRGSMIMDVPVLGRGRDIASLVDRYSVRAITIGEVIVAMPSASGRQTREAIANCRSAGVSCRIIPKFRELLAGKVLSSQIRDINLTDLLGREPVQLDEQQISGNIAGRSLLITGAAGSIGSELCRQAARFRPARLVLLDQAESALYNIDLELRARFPQLEIVSHLADVRDVQAIERIIERYAIDSILHAAAYKHVPLMESHVVEAVRTNVFGTWNLVRAAYRHGVSQFLMISTDKAVNPSSVMGVTKRIAELIVHARSSGPGRSRTRFASVRFGNVLGSNGSVVPLFQSQIAAGGPVTVTHPDMRRYFMSIPEAVELVLQASSMCKDSEIFVLDMGEPVRIMDLAANMIRLAGLVPQEDIEIRITGLRPGEKLFEELRIEGEDISPTYHEKIKIFSGTRLSRGELEVWLADLLPLMELLDEDAIVRHLQALVPEYAPARTLAPAASAAAGAAAVQPGPGGRFAWPGELSLRSLTGPPSLVQPSFTPKH
jgi:FlaA1/EpsC-like NDP-sugar epimerase